MQILSAMLIIPAFLSRYRSLADKSLQLTLDTNQPSPEQMMALQNALQRAGFIAFKDDPFTNEDLELMDSLKTDYEDTTKTPSSRLRAVMFINWKQFPQGYTTFKAFYESEMEKLINHFKSKIL